MDFLLKTYLQNDGTKETFMIKIKCAEIERKLLSFLRLELFLFRENIYSI